MNRDQPETAPSVDWPESSERCVLDLIQSIKSNNLVASSLGVDDRQACVEHLGAEGMSVPKIAKILGRCDRTIARDRGVIQQRSALGHDPVLAGVMAGRLMSELNQSVGRIRRATRGGDVPPAVRVDGERACVEILCKIVERLQSMGYLPTAASSTGALSQVRRQDSLPTIYRIISLMNCLSME